MNIAPHQTLRARLPNNIWPWLRIMLLAIVTILGVILINYFVVRSYRVVGPSMQPTLQNDDQLLVSKVGRTLANVTGQQFTPKRGDIIVFKNPLSQAPKDQAFITKRAIGLPGERVVVAGGHIGIFNQQHPEGFNPDVNLVGAPQYTAGNVDRVVPDGELFVVGDNRAGSSTDSRNGLSTIPLQDVEGTVWLRIFPLTKWRGF